MTHIKFKKSMKGGQLFTDLNDQILHSIQLKSMVEYKILAKIKITNKYPHEQQKKYKQA